MDNFETSTLYFKHNNGNKIIKICAYAPKYHAGGALATNIVLSEFFRFAKNPRRCVPKSIAEAQKRKGAAFLMNIQARRGERNTFGLKSELGALISSIVAAPVDSFSWRCLRCAYARIAHAARLWRICENASRGRGQQTRAHGRSRRRRLNAIALERIL